MELQEAQIQAIHSQADLAAGGDKGAITFFEGLRRQAAQGPDKAMSAAMLEVLDEILAAKGMTSFGKPLLGINLQPAQIAGLREQIAKADSGDIHSQGFLKSLEAQALAGEPASIQYMKARDMIRAENQAQTGSPLTPYVPAGQLGMPGAAAPVSVLGVSQPGPPRTAAGIVLPMPPAPLTSAGQTIPSPAPPTPSLDSSAMASFMAQAQAILTDAIKARDDAQAALAEVIRVKDAIALVFARPSAPQADAPVVTNGGG